MGKDADVDILHEQNGKKSKRVDHCVSDFLIRIQRNIGKLNSTVKI